MMNANTSEEANKKKGEEYTRINKEVETLLGKDDGIVFAPAQNFEYTAPLEDFKRSQDTHSVE